METRDGISPGLGDATGNQKVEIRVKGRIDESWSEWFQGFTIQPGEEGESIILGNIKDQADLYGVIAKMRDLGMTLISVNKIDDPQRKN